MPVTAIATAVTAGAGIYSANKQASAAKKASSQAAATANQEMELQREARDEARKIFTPYSQEGAQARRMYDAAMGIAPAAGTSASAGVVGADTLAAARSAYDSGFEASPYWRDAQYASGEALNALQSTNAAMGRGSSINSGKALRAASDIQQGYRGAATQNYLNSLGGIIDTGLTADSGIASGGQTYANNSGNALRNATALQGQYGMAGAAAYGNAASDIAGVAGYAMGNYRPGGQNYFSGYSAPYVNPIQPYGGGAAMSPTPTVRFPTINGGGGGG